MFSSRGEVLHNDVHEEIERSVSIGNNFKFTKVLLEAKYETTFNEGWDCKYIEDYYVESLKQHWLQEAHKLITSHIHSSHITEIRESLVALNTFSDCYNFIFGFGFIINEKVKLPSLLYTYTFLLKELSTSSSKLQYHEKQYVHEFKNECVHQLMSKAHDVQNEYFFFKSFLDFLKSSKNPEEVCRSLGILPIQSLENEVNFKKFLDILIKSQNEDIFKVQKAAKKIVNQIEFTFNKELGDTISSYLKPTIVKHNKVDERRVLEVLGSHVVVSKVLDEVEKTLQNKQVEEVHFVATVIHIDTDLSARIWHGKNIVVLAETAIISDDKSVTWNVSGKDAAPPDTRQAGTGDNGWGITGADGKDGESGGNVFITVDELINGDNFSVTSNGGNGGKGQDGGNGEKGKDGFYLTERPFKELFPPASKFINSKKDTHLNITKDNVLRSFKSLDECYAGSSSFTLRIKDKEDFEEFLSKVIQDLNDFYFEVKCHNGCKITFSFYYGSLLSVCQSFLLHEGSPGEEGKPGGSGGKGGVEGFAGDVDIEVKNELYSNCTLSMVNGEKGMPGSFGMCGIPGKKGADRAYKDYSLGLSWPKYVIPNEKDNRKLHIKYSKDRSRTNVYTAYNDSYAEIGEKENDIMVLASLQMASINKCHKERTMLDKLTQRKKTICKQSMKNQYKQKLHRTGLFKFNSLINNAKSIIDEKNKLCDETIEKQSEHITTEFKITKQVSFSGKKRVNPLSILSEQNLTIDILEERPNNSLINISADELIELITNDPSLPNWIKLLQIRLTLDQIISLWGKIASTKCLDDNSPNGELNALEIGFCNKFQLAALEYFATKLDISDHDSTSMSNNYSNNLLKLTDMSLNSFNKLFTIKKKHESHSSEVNQYLLRDFLTNDEKNREYVLEQYLDLLNNPSNDINTFNAILVVFINECIYIYDNTLKLRQGVDVLIDRKKKRVSAKFDCFKSVIWTKQHETLYNDLLKGIVEENNHSLIKFENEIRDDQFVSTVYNTLVRRAQEQYVLEDVIKFDKSEIDKLLSYCFLDCGPFSATYREFLAHQHKTNILVYSINENNKVILMYNHNPRATTSVHFLMKENTFEHLNVNNDFVEMLNNHHSKCQLVNGIQIYIDSLNVKDICNIVSKQPFMLDLNNDVYGDKSLRMHIKLKHIFMEDINIKQILECYHSDAEKELLSCRLQKLKLEYTGCSSILDYLALHFENEGAHISSKELVFVLNFVLKCTLNVPHVLPILTWIISAYSQTQWLVEIILLKIELNLQKTLQQPLKSKWREYLCVHNQKDILMLIMEKICEKDLEFSEKKFEETIYLLSKIPQNHLGLEKVHLDEWKYYLKDKFWTQQLIKLGHWDDDNLRSASYYLMVLENLVGIEICEKLVAVLKTHEAELSESSTINELPDIFRTIADKEVCLNYCLLKMFEECRISEWMDRLKQKCFSSNVERSVSKLSEIIKNSSNTSKKVLMKLDSIAQSVDRCNNAIRTMDSHIKNEPKLKKFISKLIDSDDFFDKLKRNLQNISITDDTFKDLGKSLIKTFFPHNITITNIKSNEKKVDLLVSSPDLTQSYETLLAIVVIAIKLKHNKTLRDTQKITILTMLQSERNVLCQVATGEGKSLIVVAVAIIKVLMGRQKVDIITSSRVLAMRDAEQYKDLYELFDIRVGHNCSENIEERKLVYSDNSVVYGELANFQRDFLLDRIHNHNIRGDRLFKTIIVDEVDSMLLDKGNNTLYLSHEIPGLDKLESVFIYIWKTLHIPAESGQLRFQQVVSVLKNKILHDLFGIVTKEDLRCLDTRLGDREVNMTWHYLLKEKIIDDTGKVLKELEEDKLNGLPEKSIHKDHLNYLFKKVNERMKCLEIPNYLKLFVEKHLEEWITSGVRAMTMEPGVDYVVDVDRSESSCDRSPNIMIVDQDTGTDQVNSQWENGLHQFLQIKHGCRLSLITLKAVFISNVTFLRKYDYLYGLSGTLGSKIEREFLVELYNVNYVTIPTAKTKSFVEEVPIVCSNTAEWLDTICSEVCKKTESRSVLIVCETVNDVKTLERKFIELSSANKINYKQIHTYTRDYEELTIAKTLESGHIIISTNLAGRGTDIKLTTELIDAGGLHVCLSYLPGNSRIEEQAFGRAARNGEPGSGQLIVNSYDNSSNSLKIIYLKCQRDVNENLRISDIKDFYNSQIKLEEKCFDQFQVTYELISKAEHPENIKSILLQTSLDQWAFWLEENKNYLNLENIKDFLKEISKLKETEFSVWSNNVKDPFQMIKLGLVLINEVKFDESILLFERVINEEPFFSESAYYYRLMAISKRKDIANKEIILDDLKLVSMKLKDRLTNYSLRAFTADYLKKKSPKAVLQIESFKEQQLNIAQIHNVLLQSIYKIVGYEISNEDFYYLSDKNDEIIASRVFSDLIEKGVIEEPTINTNISDKDFRFAIQYGIDPNKMISFFKNYEKKSAVNELELLKDLKSEFCHLPSRERFWSMMILKNILTDEKQYCIVDLHKLNLVDPSLVDDVKTLKESIIKQGNEVWMYQPEECHPKDCTEDNFILLRREVLVEKIGEPKYAFLLNKSIFYENSLATLMLPKDDVDFEDFDCLKKDDFRKLGISLDTAFNIIDELKEKQIIQNRQRAEGYILLINYSAIENIELSSFKGYSDDVIKLLNFCFAFRIALQKMVDLTQNKDALFLPLPIRIHHNIIRDLSEHGIISKHVINPEKDISKALADVYPEAMTKEEYYKLFCDLFDSSTTKEIVDELISNECLTKKMISWDRYVIGQKKLKNLTFESPHLECKKDTIKLVLERQKILGTDKTKNAIEQIIKGRSSMLYKTETPVFNVKPLYHELQQTKTPVSDCNIFSLNGFDQILVLEEKKWTMKMIIQTGGAALIGVSQIAVGVYMQFLLLQPLLGAKVIQEGISDIIYAVTCCFSGRFSWKQFGINKIISLIIAGCMALNSLSKFKSMFGKSVNGASVLSSQKSECTSMLGKAANAIKKFFKPLSTETTVNKTVILKSLAKQVVAQSALGCSIGIAYGTIDNYLQPELQKIGEDLVERCSVDIHDVASENLLENIKEIYFLVGPKEAQRKIRMCYCSVLQECMINSKSDWKFLIGKLFTIVDQESLSRFQELRNEVTPMNVCLLLTKLGCVLLKLKECIDSCSSIFSGNSIVSKIVDTFERNLTKTLKELKKTSSNHHSQPSSGPEPEAFVDNILDDLEKEVKFILVENIKNIIINPLLIALNTTCIKYLSNMAADKCFTLLKEEEVMEITKYNEEMYKSMEFGEVMHHKKNTFYQREYNDYLLEILQRRKSLPVFREILENNYSINRTCIELCCTIIPMALKTKGFNVPMLRVVLESNGVRRVYGGCNGSEKDVLTITISDDIENNIKENKILIRSFLDSVYKTMIDAYPEYRGFTSEALYRLVTHALENDFYVRDIFREFDTHKSTYIDNESNDDDLYTCFQNVRADGNTHKDSTVDESSSPYMDTKHPGNSESEIKVVKITKDEKMRVIDSFKAALEKINSHLHKTQPYLKSFHLTLEDFVETGHVLIPSHDNVPGRFFDYYTSSYELVLPFFAQPGSEQYADYIVRMALKNKKHLNLDDSSASVDLNSKNRPHIYYSVEPKDRLGRLDWGMSGSILLDVDCGDYVFTVKDCRSVGDLAQNEVEVLIFGDSMFRYISDYFPRVKFLAKHFPDKSPASKWKSNIIKTARICSKAQCVVLYFGNHAVKTKVFGDVFVRDISDLVTEIRSEMSNVKVILCEVLYPRLDPEFGFKRKVVNKITRINTELELFCKRQNVVFFRSNKFVNEKCLGKDWLHLNRRGYINISKAILNQINASS